MKALKIFIKPLEALQRSVQLQFKYSLNYSLNKI